MKIKKEKERIKTSSCRSTLDPCSKKNLSNFFRTYLRSTVKSSLSHSFTKRSFKKTTKEQKREKEERNKRGEKQRGKEKSQFLKKTLSLNLKLISSLNCLFFSPSRRNRERIFCHLKGCFTFLTQKRKFKKETTFPFSLSHSHPQSTPRDSNHQKNFKKIKSITLFWRSRIALCSTRIFTISLKPLSTT